MPTFKAEELKDLKYSRKFLEENNGRDFTEYLWDAYTINTHVAWRQIDNASQIINDNIKPLIIDLAEQIKKFYDYEHHTLPFYTPKKANLGNHTANFCLHRGNVFYAINSSAILEQWHRRMINYIIKNKHTKPLTIADLDEIINNTGIQPFRPSGGIIKNLNSFWLDMNDCNTRYINLRPGLIPHFYYDVPDAKKEEFAQRHFNVSADSDECHRYYNKLNAIGRTEEKSFLEPLLTNLRNKQVRFMETPHYKPTTLLKNQKYRLDAKKDTVLFPLLKSSKIETTRAINRFIELDQHDYELVLDLKRELFQQNEDMLQATIDNDRYQQSHIKMLFDLQATNPTEILKHWREQKLANYPFDISIIKWLQQYGRDSNQLANDYGYFQIKQHDRLDTKHQNNILMTLVNNSYYDEKTKQMKLECRPHATSLIFYKHNPDNDENDECSHFKLFTFKITHHFSIPVKDLTLSAKPRRKKIVKNN